MKHTLKIVALMMYCIPFFAYSTPPVCPLKLERNQMMAESSNQTHPAEMSDRMQASTKKNPNFFNRVNFPSVPYESIIAACTPATLLTVELIHSPQRKIGFISAILMGHIATLSALYYKKYRSISREPATVEPGGQLGYLQLSGDIANTDKFHDALKKCLDNDQVVGIVIKLNADWGVLGICQAMFLELKRASSIKPVIALIEQSCCREPYLIACAADYIIANEHSTIGMIGTTYGLVEQKIDPTKELYYFYAGKLTPLGDPLHHITPEEQIVIAQKLEKHYQQLCKNISEQRALSLATASEWAEGKPFTGTEALQAGLIDHIGTLSDVYDSMEQLLKKRNINHGNFELVPYVI